MDEACSVQNQGTAVEKVPQVTLRWAPWGPSCGEDEVEMRRFMSESMQQHRSENDIINYGI